MGAIITGVARGSAAQKNGVRAGDRLLRLNGHEIEDVLDYRFYMVDEHAQVEIEREGKPFRFTVEKGEYDDLGLEFSTYLMDEKHRCRNSCIFCFIDQLPKGMRGSLYFKDDDARLSFLMGNYITLTNLSQRDVDRIIALHLSPVNVSIHTMNPQLRVKMMRNRNAGESLEKFKRLAQAGTKLNCQLVLCPGINDGGELDRTLTRLGEFYPSVQSVAAVPVGLTRFRDGLFPLSPFSVSQARRVVEQMEAFGGRFKTENGTRLAFASDEFYIRAGIKLHGPEFYESFLQLENGVGMMTLLLSGFSKALTENTIRKLPAPRKISLATGTLAYPFIQNCIESAQKAVAQLCCEVYAINNDFFGENVNVSGLVTGGDLISQLKGRELGAQLLIPSSMLRAQKDRFLDDKTPEDVEKALGVRVTPVDNDGRELFDALMGKTGTIN